MPKPKKDKEPRQKQKQRQKQTVIVNVGTTRRRRQKQSQRSEPAPRAPPFMPIPFPVPALRGPDQLVPPPPTLAQLLQAFQAQPLGNAPAPAALAPPAIPTQAIVNPVRQDIVRDAVKQQSSLFETLREQNETAYPVVSNPVSPIYSSTSLPSDRVAPIPEMVIEGKEEAGPDIAVAPPAPLVEPPGPIVAARPAPLGEPGNKKRTVPRPRLTKEQAEEIGVFDPNQGAASSSSSSSQKTPGVPLYSMENLLSRGVRIKDQSTPEGRKNSLEQLARDLKLRLPKAILDMRKEAVASWIYKRI